LYECAKAIFWKGKSGMIRGPYTFTFCYSLNVSCPPLKPVAHLRFIPSTIVDASDASPMTADVVQDCLDNVRQYPEAIGHHSCSGTAKVMDAPIEGFCLGVDLLTGLQDAFVKRDLGL
jgi:hypothetical protein